MNIVNKHTKLYGSFSLNPGNNGSMFFNHKFEQDNINAIYKSFYSDNIKDSVFAARILNFSGFAISMPFKTEVLEYVDEIDPVAQIIGAANTVVNNNEHFKAYNTDWIGVSNFFKDKGLKHINIIGTGGFAKAIMYAFTQLGINFSIVNRKNIPNIDKVTGEYFINATPAEIKSKINTIFDARGFTEIGKEIFKLQAEEQYKLYINA
jgi:shikimate dehydrogenase